MVRNVNALLLSLLQLDYRRRQHVHKHKPFSICQPNTDVSNSKDNLIDELATLLNETAEAHHKAFSATNGEDAEWPIWYADYLLEKMRIMLNYKFTKSELIYILVSAEKENGRIAPGAYWPKFYANFIVSRYT
jgi:hypothetical protein